MYGGMVVLYTMAAQTRPWQRRLMLTGWILGVVITMRHQSNQAPFEYAFHLMGLVAAYALGVLTRVQRAYTAELEDRAVGWSGSGPRTPPGRGPRNARASRGTCTTSSRTR